MQNVHSLVPRSRILPKSTPDRGGEFNFHNEQDLCKFVGGEIRASRLNFTKLAAQAGCCPQTVANLAHGDTQFPRVGTVLRILRALGFELIVRG